MELRGVNSWTCFLILLVASGVRGADVNIGIDARQPGHPVSRYLTGACIEDVNHEIYGGIYSQMIFGESFQEPSRGQPVKGFAAVDGVWSARNGQLFGDNGPGSKLLSSTPDFAAGEVGVEIFLPGTATGNAGLIVKAGRAGAGADNFDGYEISLDARSKTLRIGRHRHDWTLLKDTPCDIAADRWIVLVVKMTESTIEVLVDGKSVASVEDRDRPLRAGTIGLRQWQRPATYRNLWIKSAEKRIDLPFEAVAGERIEVSGMWRPTTSGSAVLAAEIEKGAPFIGTQSQRITFAGGEGEVGIENRGLNRWGLSLAAGKPYEGYLWIRAEKAMDVYAVLENADGSRRYAEARLAVGGEGWRRYDFALTPSDADAGGRFAIKLKASGTVAVGHAFLQPGEWGRFKGLPLRRDVVEGLIDQEITVLRYGGSMVNAAEYRWKKMIGPRDRRPPYKGTWYAQSSNGWGIIDFLDLCEAAGFLGIPAFNMDETPQDMADFVEYVNGPADSEWGRKRVQDGHPRPYGLAHIELGNEERVDDRYFAKFAAIAKAIWAKDPQMTLVVGDFAYDRAIRDPMNFSGAASRITTLAAHQKVMDLARQNGREVWFDVHLGTDGPAASTSLRALPSYIDALQQMSGGAKHKVVVFELNANNHQQRRALANAQAIGTIQRDGRLPIVTSANCLQCDGQNDNGWNQGLLFLNPSKTWLQPPGYVTQMIARNYQPRCLDAQVTGEARLDVTAARSEDGKTLILQVVNLQQRPISVQIHVDGFAPAKPAAAVEVLAGPLDAANTAQEPQSIAPRPSEWRHEMKNGTAADYTLAAYSFTIIRLE